MKLPLVIILLTIAMFLSAAGASMFFVPHVTEFGEDITVDRAGNVYFVGVVNHDPNTLCDYVTIKYNKYGKNLWERWYHTPVEDLGQSTGVAIDSEGNCSVTGITRLGYTTIKYDVDGKQLWLALYDEPQKELSTPVGIAVDGKGNVYIAGESREPDPLLDPNIPEDTDDEFWTPPDSDFVTIKYNTKGKQLWAVHYAGPRDHEHEPADIAVDKAGNVLVTGSSVIGRAINKCTSHHIVTIKYDTNGKQVWEAIYTGKPDRFAHSGEALAIDSALNVYVACSSMGIDSQYSDFVTIKYDATGKEKWVALYRESGKKWVFPTAIAVGKEGNVYVSGYTSPRWTASGDSPLPDNVGAARKNHEFVTLKYNPRGQEQWVAKYKDSDGRAIFSDDLMVDAVGNIYILGFSLDETGEQDAFIVKYDPDGNEKSVRRFETKSQLAKFLSALSRP